MVHQNWGLPTLGHHLRLNHFAVNQPSRGPGRLLLAATRTVTKNFTVYLSKKHVEILDHRLLFTLGWIIVPTLDIQTTLPLRPHIEVVRLLSVDLSQLD